jgi:hypothetical protein
VKNLEVLYNGEDWGSVEKLETKLVTGKGGDDLLEQMAPDLLLSNIPRYFSKDIEIIEKLAEGGFSVVSKRMSSNNTVVVIKEPKGNRKKQSLKIFLREAFGNNWRTMCESIAGCVCQC